MILPLFHQIQPGENSMSSIILCRLRPEPKRIEL